MTAWGQGYVNFASAGAGVNAPMTNWTSSGVCCPWQRASGNGFVAMLYIAPAGTGIRSAFSTNGVAGSPAAFLTGAQAGYFLGGTRAITGYSPGDTISAQVRMWNSYYASWESAMIGERGNTYAIQVKLADTPAGASNLVGLRGAFIGPRDQSPPRLIILSNKTVRAGNTVTLVPTNAPNNCDYYTVLCAYPSVMFAWSFHGTNISFAQTLTITNAQPSDAGVYTFHAENEYGFAEISASLTVTGPPPAVLLSPKYTNGGFQFTLAGEAGSNYVIQSSTDLTVSNWVSRVTNTAPFTFVETNFALSPQRFYRAINR